MKEGNRVSMKLVGLILVGLCAGFVSGKAFDPFFHFGFRDLRSHLSKDDLNAHCKEIYKDYSIERVLGFSPFIKHNIFKFCGIPLYDKNLFHEESSKHVSAEIPPKTKSASTPVFVSTRLLSKIRYPKASNSFKSEEKITKYTNPGTHDDISTEPSSLKRNTDSTNPNISDDFSSTEASNELGLISEITNPKISNDAFIEISNETDGTTEITTPKDSSSIQESNATEKSTEITNTTISDVSSKEEVSEVTDEIKETTNSTAPDNHPSDETSGVTSDVAFTIPDKKEPTESSSKLTGVTLDVKDPSTPSTPVTTISKGTSDEMTHVTDSLEISSVTAGLSEPTSSEISRSTISSETTTEMQTRLEESPSTTPKSTVFISTDYSTSEKTNSGIEGESFSTTVSSSSVRPNILSTRLYSTERVTKVTTSQWSRETTLGDRETTHSITTIELPGTRTLKLAVSITFLAIALIALVVLVVYLIATRRRTFSYDELLLMP